MKSSQNYRTRIISSLSESASRPGMAWRPCQAEANPFLSFAFLHALHESGSAAPEAGWQPQYLTLWQDDAAGRCPAPVRQEPFLWRIRVRLGLGRCLPAPRAGVLPQAAVGDPLHAGDRHRACWRATTRRARRWSRRCARCSRTPTSPPPICCIRRTRKPQPLEQAGFMLRTGVQFHWQNAGYRDFEQFLATLRPQETQEHPRRTAQGARGRHHAAARARHRCDRGRLALFQALLRPDLCEPLFDALPEPGFLPAHRARHAAKPAAGDRRTRRPADCRPRCWCTTAQTLYGRYWGALEHHPCLHFETAYYQPLEFCIEHGIAAFEGGAQGEHKMARGFLPQKTWSAHWLAHPAFADAVERFLERETGGIDAYIDELNERNPFRTRRRLRIY